MHIHTYIGCIFKKCKFVGNVETDERFRFLRFSLSIGKCRFHERSKSHGISRGKNRCGDAHYSWSSAEKVKSAVPACSKKYLSQKPVSLLTHTSASDSKFVVRFNNIDRARLGRRRRHSCEKSTNIIRRTKPARDWWISLGRGDSIYLTRKTCIIYD